MSRLNKRAREKLEAMGDLPIMVADQTLIDAAISIKLIKRIPLSQGGKK